MSLGEGQSLLGALFLVVGGDVDVLAGDFVDAVQSVGGCRRESPLLLSARYSAQHVSALLMADAD